MRRPNPFSALKKTFGTGLLLLCPLLVTIWVFNLTVEIVFLPLSDAIEHLLSLLPNQTPFKHALLSFSSIVTFVFCVACVGVISKRYSASLGSKVIETIFVKTPLLKTIYGLVKQIANTFQSSQKTAFKDVVMLEFPKQGMYTIGFVTDHQSHLVQGLFSEVFVPMTPNPTTGFWITLPKDQLVALNMTPSEAMKKVLSIGMTP